MASVPVFQQRVATFVNKHQLKTDVAHRVLDLASEVGELAKEVLRSSRYGAEPFTPSEEWRTEISDVFFSLICLANSTGVNLEEGLSRVLQKYQQRIEQTGDAGSERASHPDQSPPLRDSL